MPSSIHSIQRPLSIVLVLLAAPLVGCVTPEVPLAPGAADVVPAAVDLSYACPPGDTVTLDNGLCVTTFVDARETFEEPYVAVHPQRPAVMVLGMNAWHADPRPVLRDGVPSLEVGRVALFVTEDGGANWRRVESPPILYGTDAVGTTSYSGDPTLAFDSRGVLHYLQTSVSFDRPMADGFPYLDIQYARSEDLGDSWSQNLLLADDGDNDRPWLTVHDDDVLVTWRNIFGEKPPEVAWSGDGGETWDTASGPPECINGDRAIVRPEGVLVPCELHEDGRTTGLQMNLFDRETKTFEALSRIPTPEGWRPSGMAHLQWDESHDGSAVAVATRQDDPGGFVAFSHDGGVTWSRPLPLVDLCKCDTDTGSVHTVGARFDAWGAFHVLLVDANVQTPDHWDETNSRYARGERAVFHIAVDADGNLLHQEKLFTSIQDDPRVPPSVGPPIGRDDYYIPAFWSGGGAIAWTRDKGVDLTHVVVEASSGAS